MVKEVRGHMAPVVLTPGGMGEGKAVLSQGLTRRRSLSPESPGLKNGMNPVRMTISNLSDSDLAAGQTFHQHSHLLWMICLISTLSLMGMIRSKTFSRNTRPYSNLFQKRNNLTLNLRITLTLMMAPAPASSSLRTKRTGRRMVNTGRTQHQDFHLTVSSQTKGNCDKQFCYVHIISSSTVLYGRLDKLNLRQIKVLCLNSGPVDFCILSSIITTVLVIGVKSF